MGPTGHKMPFEFYKELDDAGIPWSYKITDNSPDIRVMQLARESTTANYIIFRRSVGIHGNIGVYDVPDYNKTPIAASLEHFELHYDELPPEVIEYRDVVIIEDINEPNKDDDAQVEWLAEFSIYEMQRWDEVGFRYACFGWAGGTPEPRHWEGEKMLDLLRICASNKGNVFIAVHEYSLNSDIWNGAFPDNDEYWYVGRFTWIHKACDKHGIGYPDILITEWGYGKDTHLLPTHAVRMIDYVSVGELYAKYPNVKCATIWCYNGESEWGGLGEILHSEDLEPLRQAILTTEYPPVEGEIPPVGNYKSVVVKIAQEHTREEWATISEFAFDNYKRTQTASHDNAVVMVEDGNSESYIYIVDPSLESQQAMIDLCTVRGITWIPVLLRDVPVEPDPDYIDVVNLNQRDARWGNQLCGFGPKTISNWGCLLATYAMLNDHFLDGNTAKDVGDENDYYKSKGGFSGNNLVSMAMSRVYSGVKNEGWLTRGTAMTNRTLDYLARGIPVPARVDFKPETGQFDQHWVLIVGHDSEKGWIMNDPWTGLKGVYVSDYYNISGDDVLECIYYYHEEDTTPPPTNQRDLLPYLQGNGVIYEVKNANGGQERFQTQTHGQEFWQTKNTLAEQLMYDNNFIYRGWDISPGNGRYYVQEQPKGTDKAQWLPRRMSINQTFTTSLWVQFYNWDCSESSGNTGQVSNTIRYVAHYSTWESRAGITLNDVIELEWVNGGERYFYAKGYGLVGWERSHQDPNTPAWSAISEIHGAGQRPDNNVALPNCL